MTFGLTLFLFWFSITFCSEFCFNLSEKTQIYLRLFWLLPSKHSSWWRRLEDVLKTYFVFVCRRRLDQDEYVLLSLTSSEDVFKTSWRRLGQDQYICLSHMSLRRLEDVFKTFSRRLQDIFKTFWRRLQDVFKTSSRPLQGVFKTSSRLF